MRQFQVSVREADGNWIPLQVVSADSRRQAVKLAVESLEAERIADNRSPERKRLGLLARMVAWTAADVAVRPIGGVA